MTYLLMTESTSGRMAIHQSGQRNPSCIHLLCHLGFWPTQLLQEFSLPHTEEAQAPRFG